MAQCNHYPLILMDIQMPVMNGVAATRTIRQLPGGRAAIIVAVTAISDPKQRQRCQEAGMNDFLTKPVPAGRAV